MPEYRLLWDPGGSGRLAAATIASCALGPKPLMGRHLSFVEREEIALLCVGGNGVREIARELHRNAATRGGGLEYRATTAQWHADRPVRHPKPALKARLRD